MTLPAGYSLPKETSSLYLVSLDELSENRLPPVNHLGRPMDEPEMLWWQDHVDLLPKVLAQLTVKRQALINAVFFRDVSIRAYAREMQRDESSVREQLGRTLKVLRRLLEAELLNATCEEEE